MNRITLALAAALSLVLSPLAAQESDCDGWVTSDASVAVQFWEAATSETVSDCLNAGADANAGNESGDTPLLLAAAYNSDPDVLTVLLDAGADATVHGAVLPAVGGGGRTAAAGPVCALVRAQLRQYRFPAACHLHGFVWGAGSLSRHWHALHRCRLG